jgi:Mn-dependent DtxR family transcriptional regulator
MKLEAFDVMVLRAILRLARRRQEADDAEIALRVSRPPHAVRAAVRRLAAQGLVEQRPQRGPRLTMGGLALAVGLLPRAAQTARSERRTHRAA